MVEAKEDDEKLVSLVQKYPLIFDASDLDHRNTWKRQAAFKEIADEIGSTGEICENRWRVLRTRFTKIVKGVHFSGTRKKPYIKEKAEWPLFDSLRFIEQHIVKRRSPNRRYIFDADNPVPSSSSTVPSPTSSGSELISGDSANHPNSSLTDVANTSIVITSAPELQHQVVYKVVEKLKDGDEVLEEILSHLQKVEDKRVEPLIKEGNDYTGMWLLSLKDDINRLSPRNKLFFKAKVETLMYEMITGKAATENM